MCVVANYEFDAAAVIKNEKEYKTQLDKAAQKRREYLQALRRVLETSDGISIFKELFLFTNLFSTTFTGDSKIYLREGIKTVGYKFFEDVGALKDPKLIGKVVTEILLEEK